jgi:ribonuclease P protein component
MTPPEAPAPSEFASVAETPPAVSVCLQVLTKRSDFLKAAKAKRHAMPGFIVQARQRSTGEPATDIRIGYTCSKKVGNAVARNRAKRRLREIARAVLPDHALPGWDYVLIGRSDITASRDFGDLTGDLRRALEKIHGRMK